MKRANQGRLTLQPYNHLTLHHPTNPLEVSLLKPERLPSLFMSLEDKLYPLLSVYEALPLFARQVIGSGWRSLPKRLRLGARFEEFEILTRACESWSKDQLAEYQLTQLRFSLAAAKKCPFYHEHFAKAEFDPDKLNGPAEIRSAPTISKSDLQNHLNTLVNPSVSEANRLYLTTGGSTGVPVGFYLEKGVSRPKEQAFLEAQWSRAGYEPGMKLAVIRGQVTDTRSKGRISFYDATRNWLMLSSYHLTDERLPEYLETVERFRPDILHAYPSAALQIAEFLEKAGQSWRTPLRAVLCGSERLNLPQKKLLERVFNCRVYRWYGHAERVVLAGEGQRSDLFHFWPTYGYVEFGDAHADGFREVIGTSFHNLAMPMIRYRTGDYVKLAEEDGEYPWPVVSEIAGREQEFLVTATGRRVSLTAFNMHDRIFDDLYAVQFKQDEPGVAELRYVPGPTFDSSRLESIKAAVQRKLGDDFRFELKKVSETEKTSRGKHRWIVSSL